MSKHMNEMSDKEKSVKLAQLAGWECAIHDLFRMPPAPVQRAWLDKILELAITAGLVEEVTV